MTFLQPNSPEQNRENLFEFANLFMSELTRVFRLSQQDKPLYPPQFTAPLLLDGMISAFQALSPDQPLNISPVWEYYSELFDSGDLRRISQHFYPGENYYLGFLPFDEAGLPVGRSVLNSADLLKILATDDTGLTSGFSGTQAYFINLLPPEYLQAAKVEVPAFDHTTPAAIEVLKTNFFTALSSIEKLLGFTH
jgi:hypothetical protein